MMGSGLNLVTTVIGFGMSATFIVFVCARLICGRATRADPDPADASAVAAVRAVAQPPAPFDFDLDLDFRTADLDRAIEHSRSGLDPFVIAAIPTDLVEGASLVRKPQDPLSVVSLDYWATLRALSIDHLIGYFQFTVTVPEGDKTVQPHRNL